MSYILDALRKADAQRTRDPARGIHAQPAAPAPAAASGARRGGQWLWIVLAGLIAIGAAWMWSAGETAAPPPPPVAVARLAPAPPPLLAPPTVVPATEVLPPPPAVVVAPPAAVAVAPPRPRAAASAPPAAAPAASAAASAPAVAPAPAAAAAAAPTVAAQRTYSLAELPADVRQALPKFSVSGGVYSENVAQRMLVVDGQVFNEGSEIAPGLVLEQIRARVAVLRFRGLRFTQPY